MPKKYRSKKFRIPTQAIRLIHRTLGLDETKPKCFDQLARTICEKQQWQEPQSKEEARAYIIQFCEKSGIPWFFDNRIFTHQIAKQQKTKRPANSTTKDWSYCPGKKSFFSSMKWRRVRYDALKKHGKTCALCGSNSGPLHVDHIKPRSKFPNLAYDINNLQVLCEACNFGKGARDDTDWRPK